MSMKLHSLLSEPLNDSLMWFSLAVGSGLQQLLTIALILLIWDEWPWPKFMLLALGIGFCGAFTTGLYVALALLAARFPEDLCEDAGHTNAGRPLELRPGKKHKEDFTGTHPIAA
jgi:hypothetical protein